MIERLIDAAEVAAVLGVSIREVQELAKRGDLPAFKVGRLWRFRLTEVEAWIAEQRPLSAKAAKPAPRVQPPMNTVKEFEKLLGKPIKPEHRRPLW